MPQRLSLAVVAVAAVQQLVAQEEPVQATAAAALQVHLAPRTAAAVAAAAAAKRLDSTTQVAQAEVALLLFGISSVDPTGLMTELVRQNSARNSVNTLDSHTESGQATRAPSPGFFA